MGVPVGILDIPIKSGINSARNSEGKKEYEGVDSSLFSQTHCCLKCRLKTNHRSQTALRELGEEWALVTPTRKSPES